MLAPSYREVHRYDGAVVATGGLADRMGRQQRGTGGHQQEDEEQGDGPFANGDRGKIEAHQLATPISSTFVLTLALSAKRTALA